MASRQPYINRFTAVNNRQQWSYVEGILNANGFDITDHARIASLVQRIGDITIKIVEDLYRLDGQYGTYFSRRERSTEPTNNINATGRKFISHRLEEDILLNIGRFAPGFKDDLKDDNMSFLRSLVSSKKSKTQHAARWRKEGCRLAELESARRKPRRTRERSPLSETESSISMSSEDSRNRRLGDIQSGGAIRSTSTRDHYYHSRESGIPRIPQRCTPVMTREHAKSYPKNTIDLTGNNPDKPETKSSVESSGQPRFAQTAPYDRTQSLDVPVWTVVQEGNLFRHVGEIRGWVRMSVREATLEKLYASCYDLPALHLQPGTIGTTVEIGYTASDTHAFTPLRNELELDRMLECSNAPNDISPLRRRLGGPTTPTRGY